MSAQSTTPPTLRSRLRPLKSILALLLLVSIPLGALQYLREDGLSSLVDEDSPTLVGASGFSFDEPAATRSSGEERARERQRVLARVGGDGVEGDILLDQWQPTQFSGSSYYDSSNSGFDYFGYPSSGSGFIRGNSFYPVFSFGIFFAGFGPQTPFFGVVFVGGFSQFHRSVNPTLIVFAFPEFRNASHHHHHHHRSPHR